MADTATAKRMTKEELRSHLANILQDSISWTDTVLSEDRALATRYYFGEPFGNEEDGRSQIVMTEVRDGILGVIPSVLRVIFGPERVVEFAPRRADAVALAEQESDAIQYIFADDNPGFLLTYSVLKDGLLKRIGIFKWGFVDAERKSYSLDNLTQDEILTLMDDPDVEITRVTESKPQAGYNNGPSSNPPSSPPSGGVQAPAAAAPAAPSAAPPSGVQAPAVAAPAAAPAAPEPTFDIELTKTDKTTGRIRIDAVPPEEFLYTRLSRTREDALMMAHRMYKTRGELIALGIAPKDLDEHASGPDLSLESNPEELARREATNVGVTQDPAAGIENDKILYIEAYPYIDYNGDGEAELRRICTIGPTYWPVSNDPVDERPFAIFTPDPEPHTLIGQSLADRLMDMQRVKSALVRSVFDSLSLSIFPRYGYVEGEVNVADVLNTAIGQPIRMRSPNMITPLNTEFVGQDALPLFQLIDDTIERRTGRNKGVIGLDADALQSTTASAASAAITSAQEQAELLVRIFAESTLKPMFRGVLRMMVKHKMQPFVARLRGTWVEVDPRVWDADMDVVCNVALGASNIERKIAVLEGIATKQELLLQTIGPNNPVSSLAQYAYTLRKAAELSGFKDSGQFFNALPPNFQMPSPPPQPNPDQIKAQAMIQVEQIKSASQQAIHGRELQLKALQTNLEHERELQKNATEATLKRYDIELKHHATITSAGMNHDVAQTKAALDHQIASQDMNHRHALDVTTAGAEHGLNVAELAHNQEMAERQTAAAEQAAQQQAQQAPSEAGE